jgi:hypothetical protein
MRTVYVLPARLLRKRPHAADRIVTFIGGEERDGSRDFFHQPDDPGRARKIPAVRCKRFSSSWHSAVLQSSGIGLATAKRFVEEGAHHEPQPGGEDGWGRTVPKGHGLGIAVHRSFVSYIATIVEVSVGDKGKLTVHQVDTAIDCGTFVNPERIQSQIEGAAIMGLSLAKYGEITFKDGKVQQSNFDNFPVIRMDEAPLVTNVHIVPADPDTPPSGVGEPGVPPFMLGKSCRMSSCSSNASVV